MASPITSGALNSLPVVAKGRVKAEEAHFYLEHALHIFSPKDGTDQVQQLAIQFYAITDQKIVELVKQLKLIILGQPFYNVELDHSYSSFKVQCLPLAIPKSLGQCERD